MATNRSTHPALSVADVTGVLKGFNTDEFEELQLAVKAEAKRRRAQRRKAEARKPRTKGADKVVADHPARKRKGKKTLEKGTTPQQKVNRSRARKRAGQFDLVDLAGNVVDPEPGGTLLWKDEDEVMGEPVGPMAVVLRDAPGGERIVVAYGEHQWVARRLAQRIAKARKLNFEEA